MALATVAASRTDANAFRLISWTLIPCCDAALACETPSLDSPGFRTTKPWPGQVRKSVTAA